MKDFFSFSQGKHLYMIKAFFFSFQKMRIHDWIVSISLIFLDKVSFGYLSDLIPLLLPPLLKINSRPLASSLLSPCKHAKNTDTPEPLFFLFSCLELCSFQYPLACFLASFRSLLEGNFRDVVPNHPNWVLHTFPSLSLWYLLSWNIIYIYFLFLPSDINSMRSETYLSDSIYSASKQCLSISTWWTCK